jgi:hypothetical protein
MAETILTLRDVETRLDGLQQKYGFSSEQFQNDRGERARVSDEDEFEWDAYLHHRAALKEAEEMAHRAYIRRVEQSQPSEAPASRSTAYALAA